MKNKLLLSIALLGVLSASSIFASLLLLHHTANGDKDKVKQELDRGAHINYADATRRTALHYAAANGYAEIVQLLLDRGATLQKDNAGRSELYRTRQAKVMQQDWGRLAEGADFDKVIEILEAHEQSIAGRSRITATEESSGAISPEGPSRAATP